MMAMNMPAVDWSLGFALSTGLLIGIERGWRSRDEASGTRVAGVRTFGVLGLIGGVAGMMPEGPAAVAMAAAASLLLAGYIRESGTARGISATGMLVGLLTLMLGALATTGHAVEALAAAAVVTLLLSMRETLHGWLRGMSEAEIRSVARFALIAFVILPLAPDQNMGPFDAWNPHQLWLVVVLVSGLSFTGYVATRRLGPARGLMMTALCGAIVSSTAVTVAFARRLKVGDDPPGPLMTGIAIATIVMFVRILLLTAILAPVALPVLAFVMAPALTVAAVLALRRRGPQSPQASAVALGNPLDIGAALGLALLVAVLAVAGRWAQRRFGDAGIGVVLGLTGLADVDAAVITFAGLPPGSLDARTAGLILSLPVMLNTLFKAALTVAFAPGRVGLRAAGPLVASVAASGVAAAGLLVRL
jgi:uncharacterized membrane protein (DUF4010 family)